MRGRDGGFVAVMTALIAPVVFGLCAFTIDCGHWYSVVQSVQRAADAAALAGAPYLPSDLASAQHEAVVTATANGYTAGVDAEPVAGQPNELRVTVTTTVANTFGQLLGLNTETITRSAVAKFTPANC